ncbi:hypothetical protein EC968_003076 [Mortierella alpina]|nr:hypothetical protein EC968_003076 [Mortierella alpina]
MEESPVIIDDQQRTRISAFLSIEAEDLSRLLEQLQDGDHARTALNKLVQQLNERAMQSSEESWKEKAEEAKAALATEKINFDQRLQFSETKLNALKQQLTATRQKLQASVKEAEEAGSKALELETKLSGQQSGSVHANAEIDALKSRVAALETEKRESLTALERKVSELDQVNEDYQAMSSRYQELKKEASKLESEAREAKASELSQKLQKQALQQELELATQRMTWLSSELEAKSTEFGSYRSEKTAQILQLQSDLDQARMEAAASGQSNISLQKRLKEQQDKLEESIQKNKELYDQNVIQEEQFRVEIESQRRLGELWERAATDHKSRVADLEQTLEDMQRGLSARESEYQETVNRLSEEKGELQISLEKSKMQIEQLKEERKRTDELLGKAGLLDPSGAPGLDFGQMGMLSPTAAIAGRLQKSGMSLTQVYTRYMDLQAEYIQLKSDNTQLQESMNEIVKELSDGAPLIREQQLEYQRLQGHANELSAQLEAASREKEQIAMDARKALAQLDGVVRERDLLHKENQDLDRQVQNLLWRLKAPNAPQSLAPASTLSTSTGPSTDAEKVIDEHLVLFSNIQELQQQNKQLREVARKLTQDREEAEGSQAQARRKDEQDAIEEATQAIESLQEQLERQNLQIATYKSELEILSRLIKTTNIPAASQPAGVVSPTPEQAKTGGDRSQDGEALEYAKLLAELQKSFEAYRTETSIDNRVLKDQLQQTQGENSEYRIQLGRAKSQIEVANERYKLLSDNNTHLSFEMTELRKRCTFLQETATRHEISNQKLSSDLHTERDALARLKAEIGNLKAEKTAWKAFETRLLEDNEALAKEKGHLNDLLQTVQNMANELERGSTQTKRRLEGSIASKEQEVETLKEKLKEEVETSKRMRDRREIETKEWQDKINALTAEYQSSRESLIEAKTSLEHTNAKVADLSKQIKSREEQLAIYQQSPAGSQPTGATREEQLQAQVSQLRGDLARLQAEADAGREHLAQFQAISQTNEDRLAEMTATFDQFKKSHDEEIENKSKTISTLETKLASVEEHSQSLTAELIKSQTELDEERSAWRKQKEDLEAKLGVLQRVEDRMNEMEAKYRQDLALQAAAAQEAHDNYQRELLNHARDMETLSKLKEDHSAQTADLEKYRAASETAISNLQAAELSWDSQKTVLQKNLSEVEKRCAELKDQNDKLHRHLEDVSSQALTIQQRMNAPIPLSASTDGTATESGEGAAKGSLERQLAELHDVIRYVRNEKDIVVCQHELNLQESRRLKQQLEQANKSLEKTQALLVEERNKHQDVMVSKQQHEQLLEKIGQLNLLRESNTMLRAENEKLQKRVVELEESERELQRKLDPLNAEVRDMKAELESRRSELKDVAEDRDRWRTRTTEIMNKHDRIDPTEFKELQEAVDKYKAQAAESETTIAGLKTEQEAIQARLQDMTLKLSKASAHAQAWRKKHLEEVAKLEVAQKESDAAKKRLAELEKSTEDAGKMSHEKEHLQRLLDGAVKEKEKLEADHKALSETFEHLKTRLNDSIARNKKLVIRIKETDEKMRNAGESGAAASDTQAAVAAAVKEKETEMQAAVQRVQVELKEKHDAALKASEQALGFRHKLKVDVLEKEIQNLKGRLATSESNGNGEPAAKLTAPSGALSSSAPAFTPRAAAVAGAIPGRPTHPVRVNRPGLGATAPGTAAAAARNAGGLPPRPGTATMTPSAQSTPEPGQSRLRPPPGSRQAANAASTATSQPTTAASSPRPPPASVAPVPASTPEPVATITATPAPTAASTPSTAASTAGQSSRLLLRRRKESELATNVEQPAGVTPMGAASTEATPGAGSPSMRPTLVGTTSATETRTAPISIKRQRALPVVENTPEGVPATKSQTITLQRKLVTTIADSSEALPASPPTDAVMTVDPTADSSSTPGSPSTDNATKTSVPHGQKRRLDASQTVQESITIVSTPNPMDIDEGELAEDVSTPEATPAASKEDVDVPPAKKMRPTSHVTVTEVTEVPEESGVESSLQSSTELEEGEMEDETMHDQDHQADASEAKSLEEDVEQQEQQEQHEQHEQQEQQEQTEQPEQPEQPDQLEQADQPDQPEPSQPEAAQNLAMDHSLEDELDEGVDATYGTPGATELTGEDDEDVQGDVEEGDLEAELEPEHDEDSADAEAAV